MSEALDRIDRHVVALLQAAGRSSYQELGDAVGLSAPATYQRVRKLEAAVVAFVRVLPGQATDVKRLLTGWKAASEVLECHRVTGRDGYLLKLRLGSVAELDAHLEAVRRAGCAAEAHVGLGTVFERWALPVE